MSLLDKLKAELAIDEALIAEVEAQAANVSQALALAKTMRADRLIAIAALEPADTPRSAAPGSPDKLDTAQEPGEQQIPEGFKAWGGGECPVEDGHDCEVIFHHPIMQPQYVRADSIANPAGLNWSGEDQPLQLPSGDVYGVKYAVIAYRILPQQESGEEEGELDEGWAKNLGVEPAFDRVDVKLRSGVQYNYVRPDGFRWGAEAPFTVTDYDIMYYRPSRALTQGEIDRIGAAEDAVDATLAGAGSWIACDTCGTLANLTTDDCIGWCFGGVAEEGMRRPRWCPACEEKCNTWSSRQPAPVPSDDASPVELQGEQLQILSPRLEQSLDAMAQSQDELDAPEPFAAEARETV